jgi:hypothetical protein
MITLFLMETPLQFLVYISSVSFLPSLTSFAFPHSSASPSLTYCEHHDVHQNRFCTLSRCYRSRCSSESWYVLLESMPIEYKLNVDPGSDIDDLLNAIDDPIVGDL